MRAARSGGGELRQPGMRTSGPRPAHAQANVSAINALNQMPISSNASLLQPAEAPLAAGTARIAAVAASYWNSACSHDARDIVIVE